MLLRIIASEARCCSLVREIPSRAELQRYQALVFSPEARLKLGDRYYGDLEGFYTLIVRLRWQEPQNLFNTAVFHFLAGVVAGSVFRVGTLLALLIFILGEAVVLVTLSPQFAVAWAIGNIFTAEVGYCAGIYVRRRAEQAGYLPPPVRAPSSE